MSGCALCAPGFLDNYAAVGGKWQRADQTRGRVGSILSDTGTSTGNAEVYSEGGYYGDDHFDSGSVYSESYDGVYEYYPSDEYSTAPGYVEEFMGHDAAEPAPINPYQDQSVLEGNY